MPRKPSCLCGLCPRCRARIAAKAKYDAMTPEERRAWVAKRDPERVRASDRARYERDKPKRLAAMGAYVETPAGRKAARRAKARWAAANRLKRRAHWAVAEAIESGRLQRGPCEQRGPDCSGRIDAHHDDYTKPLDVRWLCRRHHTQHHRNV